MATRTKKYWLANNPNAEITNAEVVALGDQTETELDLLDGASAGTVANSKAVIYSSAGQVKATSFNGAEGVLYANSGVVTSGAVWDSGAMTMPANSIITDLGVVCTTLVAAGSGTYGTRFGVSAGTDATYSAAIADNIKGTSTSVAVGKGVSSVATTTTSLGGAAVLVLAADSVYVAAGDEIFGRVTSSAGSITGGAFTFWVKYMQVA